MGAAIRGQTGQRNLRPDWTAEPPREFLLDPGSNVVYAEISGEVMEKDTEDAEDSLNLNELLLPPNMAGLKPRLLPTKVSRFSVSYSMQSLQGWVKQPSPCCAAASVAGAWNAIFNMDRSDPEALSHKEVLDVYIDHLNRLISTKIEAFERRLGAPLEPLLDKLAERLQVLGTPLGSKELPKRDRQMQILEELVGEVIKAARCQSRAFVPALGEVEQDPFSTENARGTLASSDDRVVDDCLALPEYERFWDLFRLDDAIEAAQGEAHPELEVGAGPAGSDEEPSQVAGAGEDDGEEAGRGRRPSLVSADEESEEAAKACGAEASQKGGVLLEINFGGASAGKKKKRKVPKAVAKRLGACKAAGKPKAAATSMSSVKDCSRDDNDESEDDCPAAEPPKLGMQISAEKNATWWEAPWPWKEDLSDILKFKSGVVKLRHPEKPNTSAIGNWAITAAFKSLEEGLPTALYPKVLAARAVVGRGKPRWPGTKEAAERGEYAGLRDSDSFAAREKAWRSLWNAFVSPGSTLLFHLKNHYALIFAVREWEEEPVKPHAPLFADMASPSSLAANAPEEVTEADFGPMPVPQAEEPPCEICPVGAPLIGSECLVTEDTGYPIVEASVTPGEGCDSSKEEASAADLPPKRRLVRQMLTARRGQRPSVWLDFEEAAQTMVGWEGYKIIQVQLKDPDLC